MAAGGLCGAVYKSTGNAPSHVFLYLVVWPLIAPSPPICSGRETCDCRRDSDDWCCRYMELAQVGPALMVL